MTREPYTPPVPGLTGPITPPEPPVDEAKTAPAPDLVEPEVVEPEPEPELVMKHCDEIAEAVGGWDAMPLSPYAARTLTNRHDKRVLVLRFETLDALETYFIEELIGSGMMADSSSKVIGTTLLIWDRDKGDAT